MTIGSGISSKPRGPDHRYGSRSPALDRAWVARRDAEGRGQSGGGGPHGAGAPAGDPDAAATRREARGAAPVGARLVTHLRVQALRRASAGRTRQAANPARRGSGARVYPVASGPPVPAYVAESVSSLAPTADRVCARRSVVLSSHVTPSTDALRGQGDRGHGHLARVPSRPDRHPRRPRAAARHRVSVAVDLVPPRPEVRLATPTAPGASGQADP